MCRTVVRCASQVRLIRSGYATIEIELKNVKAAERSYIERTAPKEKELTKEQLARGKGRGTQGQEDPAEDAPGAGGRRARRERGRARAAPARAAAREHRVRDGRAAVCSCAGAQPGRVITAEKTDIP